MFKKFKKAFTITELVIVIAVIAILAAVLIPTFSTVIGKANESAAMQECRSEWTNLSVEVMTDETAGKDYLFSIEKGGKTYYFAVIGGAFDTDAIASEKVSDSTVTIGSDSYTMTEYSAYTPENTNVSIFTLTENA